MSDAAMGRPSAFRIAVTYTDAELKDYARIVLRRQRRERSRAGWRYWGPLIAAGVVVGLLGGFFGVIAGRVPENAGRFLAVLVFAGFYIGATIQPLLLNRALARSGQANRDAFRARLGNTSSILMTDGGLFTRSPTGRAFYPLSGIVCATQVDSLVFVWLWNGSAIPLPIRLLSATQREIVLSWYNDRDGLARHGGAASRSAAGS